MFTDREQATIAIALNMYMTATESWTEEKRAQLVKLHSVQHEPLFDEDILSIMETLKSKQHFVNVPISKFDGFGETTSTTNVALRVSEIGSVISSSVNLIDTLHKIQAGDLPTAYAEPAFNELDADLCSRHLVVDGDLPDIEVSPSSAVLSLNG
jgi:hypothetical protein